MAFCNDLIHRKQSILISQKRIEEDWTKQNLERVRTEYRVGGENQHLHRKAMDRNLTIDSNPCDVIIYRACIKPYNSAADRDNSSVSASVGAVFIIVHRMLAIIAGNACVCQ